MKPTVFVTRSKAVFQESTTIYDDPLVTFDSITIQYGGGDTIQNLGPNNVSVDNFKPNEQQII